jgi:hypothetical protein
MFDLDEKLGVGQSDSVTPGWTKHFCIGLPADFHGRITDLESLKTNSLQMSQVLSVSAH